MCYCHQQLRIAIGLRLGINASAEKTLPRMVGIVFLASNLNALIKQSLSSTHIPSVLQPRHLYRTDQKRPDGLKLVPWAVGKQLLWDVTVVDSLAPSCRINTGSVCKPGTAAAEAEERKMTSIKIL